MNFLKKILNTSKVSEVELIITSPNGFHLRPIAKFVNETKKFKSKITILYNKKEVVVSNISEVLSLSLDKNSQFILRANGRDSDIAIEHLKEFFQKLMLDENKNNILDVDKIAKDKSNPSQIEPIFKGIAVGKFYRYSYREIEKESSIDINEAISLVEKELEELYQEDNRESQIFLAQRELLLSLTQNRDFKSLDDFKNAIDKAIVSIKNSAFSSKVLDYRDLEQRVLSHLGIKRILSLPDSDAILIASDILPQDIDIIKKSRVVGVVLEHGSITSHSSILLRSANIPSMILNRDIDKDIRGNIILDSINSKLILSPTKEEIKKAKDMQKQLNLASKKSFESRFDIVKTSFGKNIKILANVTDLDSAREAKEFGADGIGLLRTEFLFKTKRPTLQEEIETYKEIFELFDDITIRTLDIGGDKSLPYISIPKEDNPFLGLRGIRFSLYEKELFRQQLLAIFKAHNNRPIKIMFPMVSQKEEFIEAKEIAQEVARENSIDISNIMFGIMLEVPSVILAIKIFDREVDFYSVGTNDLTQYLFAIERTHNTLKVDPLSPILISALKIIIDTAKKPVSICGELAGIDEAVKILVKIGYDRLSVSPRLVPHIKNVVRSFNF